MEGIGNLLYKLLPVRPYLPRADDNAAPRTHWFGTKAEAWIWSLTVPIYFVCASVLCFFTLLNPFRSNFSAFITVLSCFTSCWGRRYRRWLILLQVGGSSNFSPEQFGGTISLRRSSCIAFTLYDKFCIGQRLVNGTWSRLCWKWSWGWSILSSSEWRLKLRLWLENNNMEILPESRELRNESWITIMFYQSIP